MSDTKSHIDLGIDYLRLQLLNGTYGLSCVNHNDVPKFSDGKGHLFSLFFMIRALDNHYNEIERTIMLTRILSEENNKQWGYSPRGYYKETSYNPFFVDSDDTAFALRSLRALGVYRAPDIFQEYLTDWKESQKAYVTFLNNQKNATLVENQSFENNLHIHAEVNANIFSTLVDSNFENNSSYDFIKSAQQPDGSWQGYFYPGIYYASWQFMQLLKYSGRSDSACFKKNIEFIIGSQYLNGSWGDDAYQTAFAICILSMTEDYNEQKAQAVAFLKTQQQPDGSWRNKEVVWKFIDSDGDHWLSRDNNAVITTAICIEAIRSAKV